MVEYYGLKEFSTWNEFKELAENSRLEWIFRGQSDANWELRTTLERSNIIENFPSFEDELLHDFKRGVKFYLSNESMPETLLENLSLLQHFGAPSRLLDFTESPYIAAYFAFENAREDSDKVAIWIINKVDLHHYALKYFNNKVEYNINIKRLNYIFGDRTFANVFEKSKDGNFNCIFPTEPRNKNMRYHLQQSVFIAQGSPYIPFIDQLEFIPKQYIQKIIMKVTLPKSEKKNALRDMQKMNINRATLFPGLDGYAKSLLLKYDNLVSFGESYKFIEYAQRKGLI